MAAEGPDPRTFKSSEDAFQFPIPAVRRFEQQLRGNLNENREKLRTLVGASYRDLLGTAERIIEMDEQMEHVEINLGDLGQQCDSRVLDRKIKNHARFYDDLRSQDTERYSLASQLAVLQACSRIIGRLLKPKGSTLLAAKILVMSRLLLKSLSQRSDVPPFVDSVQEELSSLRRRLLSRIDGSLSKPETDPTQLLEGMCALSLATSCTPSDVLRHFHHVRLRNISAVLERNPSAKDNVTFAFKLYINTLPETSRMIPKRLSDQLAKFKMNPLLQDRDVRSLDELNLEVHEKWLPSEVKNFTPWPRHDELQQSEAQRLTDAWSKQALSTFFTGMKQSLEAGNDFKDLISLRRDLIAFLISSRSSAALDLGTLLQGIRSALNSQIVRLSRSTASNLHEVTSEISKCLADWSTEGDRHTTPSLWDPSLLSMGISNGAAEFKEAIISSRHGRAAPVSRVASAYDSWTRSVVETYCVIKQMKDVRWEEDFIEDDEEIDPETLKTVLSGEDPRVCETAFSEALKEALSKMQQDLQNEISQFSMSEDQGRKAMFVLRVLRELRQRLALADWQSSSSWSPLEITSFGISLIAPLHSIIAVHVSSGPLSQIARSMDNLVASEKLSIRALWEGAPPLPSQPSPAAFRFLLALVKEMAACGEDLWAKGAVDVLKKSLRNEISGVLRRALDGVKQAREKEHVNGNATVSPERATHDVEEHQEGVKQSEIDKSDSEDFARVDGEAAAAPSVELSDDLRRQKLIQILFDTLYLRQALTLSKSGNQENDELYVAADMIEGEQLVGKAGLDRLQKSAAQYWKRTHLLSGLLA